MGLIKVHQRLDSALPDTSNCKGTQDLEEESVQAAANP